MAKQQAVFKISDLSQVDVDDNALFLVSVPDKSEKHLVSRSTSMKRMKDCMTKGIEEKLDSILQCLESIKKTLEGKDIDPSVIDTKQMQKVKEVGDAVCKFPTESITAPQWLMLMYLANMMKK